MHTQSTNPDVLALARLPSMRILHGVAVKGAPVDHDFPPDHADGTSPSREVVCAAHALGLRSLSHVVLKHALPKVHVKPRHGHNGVEKVSEGAFLKGDRAGEVCLVQGVGVVRLPVDLWAITNTRPIKDHVLHTQTPVTCVLLH